jgi:hypothetical protein
VVACIMLPLSMSLSADVFGRPQASEYDLECDYGEKMVALNQDNLAVYCWTMTPRFESYAGFSIPRVGRWKPSRIRHIEHAAMHSPELAVIDIPCRR